MTSAQKAQSAANDAAKKSRREYEDLLGTPDSSAEDLAAKRKETRALEDRAEEIDRAAVEVEVVKVEPTERQSEG